MSNTSTHPKKILLADDHLIVRQGMQFVIEDLYPETQISHASSLNMLLDTLKKEAFNMLILDAQFPDGVSLSVIPDIQKMRPRMKILTFTSFEEEVYSLKFIEAGAHGFLSKLSEENEIRTAVTEVWENGYYYPPLTQNLVNLSKFNPNLSNPLNQLSEREMEIAEWYIKGYGNLEIANELEIKQNTVSTYKKRIFDKLNIDSIVELAEIMNTHHNF